MFEMGQETMALPIEEKLRFEQGDQGVYFGCVESSSFTHVCDLKARTSYKAAGKLFMDDNGTRDVTEFLNVSKDDVLAWPSVAHRTYPTPVTARMESTLKAFVEKSLAVDLLIIGILNDKLGFPQGTLADLHKPEKNSGCMTRIIRAPPQPGREDKTFVTAHTDFGSLVSSLVG